MEGLNIVQGLDSLWFFGNILSQTTQSLVNSNNGEKTPTESHPKDTTPSTKSPKSTTLVLENHQNQPPTEEAVIQKCPKCGNLAGEVEESSNDDEEKERRKRRSYRRSKSAGLNQTRKIERELDFGFDDNEVYGFWMREKTKCGYERFGGQHHAKMPPFNDGMAMKQHLKSWAYAVACTVR
ncbi:unnamed protein product [Ilex paraguariensis]|uniref:Uncharacterized protein n=1 Tax=Ilex paraguariensis TaxID=185542 RepID=A0ABC8RTQ6_9AQUA